MKNGFTIIELVISIFILSIAVVAIFSAFLVMTIMTSDASDRLTANYLAQEGMEIVRNIRDTNWLKMNAGVEGATWVDGLTSEGGNNSINCVPNQPCRADYTSTVMAGNGGKDLCINSNGFYYYSDTCPVNLITKFRRKITIVPVTDVDGGTDADGNPVIDHILKVTVQVFWNAKANILDSNPSASPEKYSVTAEGTLYNWYNYRNQ